MSAAAALPVKVQPAPRARGRIRLIPRFETDRRAIAFAQTTAGKVLLLAVFGVTLSVVNGTSWYLKLALVSGMALLPRTRRYLLTLGTFLFTDFFWFEHSNLSRLGAAGASYWLRAKEAVCIILPFLLLCATLMAWVRRHPKSWAARRPLLLLLALCGLLLTGVSYLPFYGFGRFAAWAFVLTFCTYFWFLAYAVSDSAGHGDGAFKQFGTFHPFWGSTGVPWPKGSRYLRSIEAKTEQELAVTMIKGVKLVIWCFLLSLLRTLYMTTVYQKWGIPHPEECVRALTLGKPMPFLMNWLSWPGDFFADLLTISVWGHAVVATCRMAGFRALRNTYAPLSSRSIAEYWNRYYYYFKELLVDMFFYPAFIRYFKRSPRLRICFATFMAASVGNVLFHILSSSFIVFHMGVVKALLGFRNYFFYTLILSLGICVSQLRARRMPAHRGWFRERIVSPGCVLGFYCFLHVFAITPPLAGLRYLGYLFFRR